MAKKKSKAKDKRIWGIDLSYTVIDKKVAEKQKAETKKIWDAIKKREMQLDKIIKLLTRIAKNPKG